MGLLPSNTTTKSSLGEEVSVSWSPKSLTEGSPGRKAEAGPDAVGSCPWGRCSHLACSACCPTPQDHVPKDGTPLATTTPALPPHPNHHPYRLSAVCPTAIIRSFIAGTCQRDLFSKQSPFSSQKGRAEEKPGSTEASVDPCLWHATAPFGHLPA